VTVNNRWVQLVASLIAMIMIAVFAVFLQRTRMGRAMRAVSQDETGAQMAGIDLNRIFVLTMGLSCALAALAGAAALRFAPATRRGVPIGAVFLQPVRFRRPVPAAPRPGGP